MNKNYFYYIKKYKFKSVLIKMLTSYILIIIVVFISNATSYLFLKNLLIQKEVDFNRDYAEIISSIIDLEFISIIEQMNSFIQNTENRLMLDNYLDHTNRVKLIASLSQFSVRNDFIENSFIYFPDESSALSNEGSISQDSIFKTYYKYKQYDSAEIKKMINETQGLNYLPNNEVYSLFYDTMDEKSFELKNIITLIVRSKYDYMPFSMIVHVNAEKIQEIIKSNNIAKYGEIIIIDKKGFIISRSSNESPIGEIKPNIFNVVSSDDTKGAVTDHGKLIVYQKSRFTEWIYISVIPEGHILGDIRVIKYILLLIILFIILIVFFITLSMGVTIYNPLLNLINKIKIPLMNEKKFKNELEALSSMLDILTIENSDYQTENILKRVLKTGVVLKEIDSSFIYTKFQVVVFRFVERTEMSVFIQEYFKEQIPKDFNMHVFDQDENEIIIIVNIEENIESVYSFMRTIKSHLEEKYPIFFAVGIGSLYDQIKYIYQSYQEALNAIEHGTSTHNEYIYKYTNDIEKINIIDFIGNFEVEIMKAVRMNKKQTIRSSIEELFKKHNGILNLYKKNIGIEIINTYLKLKNNKDLKFDVDKAYDFFKNEIRIEKITEYVINAFESLLDNEEEVDKYLKIGMYIKQYIEKNYSDPSLSIETVALQLNLSSSYVSTIFKKTISINFSQYLVDFRIQKAKEMLENMNYLVKDISCMAGFGTYNNFSKAFKKILGVSPGEYREYIKKESIF